MKLKITGTLRDIANSAWISTLDEGRAHSRTEESVDKVTDFLVENLHTSPFESVSMTFFWDVDSGESAFMEPYIRSRYSRVSREGDLLRLTIDLWNFAKTSLTVNGPGGHTELMAWDLFRAENPSLAAKVEKFDLFGQKFDKYPDASLALGQHNMKVELISLHEGGSAEHSRATWRVKCPLSIATQMLRHRSGSFNQVSGRYRTISQEFVSKFDDVSAIIGKVYKETIGPLACGSIMYDIYHAPIDSITKEYLYLMRSSRIAKKAGAISNDEYKRLREVARYVLPEGRMTELYVTFYLDDLDHYLFLRDSPHAQLEHQWVAQQMRITLNEHQKDKTN